MCIVMYIYAGYFLLLSLREVLVLCPTQYCVLNKSWREHHPKHETWQY
jgi:hypothetical protein